ncbi:hypothetical protein GSQ51_17900 [Clostridioides difficile]|nr:hypothetical protein [Clostridioides difficile]NJK15962.1 hypothetical protein [Clostridioides difficile]
MLLKDFELKLINLAFKSKTYVNIDVYCDITYGIDSKKECIYVFYAEKFSSLQSLINAI